MFGGGDQQISAFKLVENLRHVLPDILYLRKIPFQTPFQQFFHSDFNVVFADPTVKRTDKTQIFVVPSGISDDFIQRFRQRFQRQARFAGNDGFFPHPILPAVNDPLRLFAQCRGIGKTARVRFVFSLFPVPGVMTHAVLTRHDFEQKDVLFPITPLTVRVKLNQVPEIKIDFFGMPLSREKTQPAAVPRIDFRGSMNSLP